MVSHRLVIEARDDMQVGVEPAVGDIVREHGMRQRVMQINTYLGEGNDGRAVFACLRRC
jgi:hypothetical protein